MGEPVMWFEISSSGSDTLNAFYGTVFGWKSQQVMDEPRYWTIDEEQGGIAGGIGDADGGGNRVTFYVGVDDVQGTLDRIVAAGGSVVMPVTTIPDMVTLALFADPQGNVIGLTRKPA